MRNKCIVIVLLLLAMGLTSAYAGSELKLGTAGAQELVIPVGARGAALGGSVVANSFGIDALFWNPAGLATMEGTEAMFTHQPYIADIDINYGAIGTNIEDFGALAISVKIVSIGDIEETTEADPEGTGTIFSPNLSVIGLTYSRRMTANVQFGITASFINETIHEGSASGMAFDFGVRYEPRWRGLALGIAMKNYGPTMKFEGSFAQRTIEEAGRRRVFLQAAPFELPASISIGAAIDLMDQEQNSVVMSGNFNARNHGNDLYQGGIEYAYDQKYFLRGGFNYSNQEKYLYGATLGGGLVFDLGESKLMLDYSWTDTETFASNQYFTVRAAF